MKCLIITRILLEHLRIFCFFAWDRSLSFPSYWRWLFQSLYKSYIYQSSQNSFPCLSFFFTSNHQTWDRKLLNEMYIDINRTEIRSQVKKRTCKTQIAINELDITLPTIITTNIHCCCLSCSFLCFWKMSGLSNMPMQAT